MVAILSVPIGWRVEIEDIPEVLRLRSLALGGAGTRGREGCSAGHAKAGIMNIGSRPCSVFWSGGAVFGATEQSHLGQPVHRTRSRVGASRAGPGVQSASTKPPAALIPAPIPLLGWRHRRRQPRFAGPVGSRPPPRWRQRQPQTASSCAADLVDQHHRGSCQRRTPKHMRGAGFPLPREWMNEEQVSPSASRTGPCAAWRTTDRRGRRRSGKGGLPTLWSEPPARAFGISADDRAGVAPVVRWRTSYRGRLR